MFSRGKKRNIGLERINMKLVDGIVIVRLVHHLFHLIIMSLPSKVWVAGKLAGADLIETIV